MFTGLVEEMGKIVNISKKATGFRDNNKRR